MTKTHATSSAAALLLVALVCGISGCGSKEQPKHSAALSGAELLDILEDDLKRHDPKDFVEVELGKFKISRVVPEVEHAVNVKFQLIAVVHSQKKEEFTEAVQQYEKRIRDAVIAVIQQAEIERLTDPTLQSLKDELISTVARVTRTRLLKDVAFSEFGMDRN